MSISQDIESKIDIVELVREYVPLKKAGVNYKWLSPFKAEKTPSFVVSPAKQIAYCFATNQWWGPIKFLMLIEKLEFKEALQILAKRAGVQLKTDSYKEKWDVSWQLFEIHEIAAKHYHTELLKSENANKLQYLLDRWLTWETIETWQIGYSENPRDLFFKLKDKGFEEKVILWESGIFVNQHKDRFFERINFPIRNYRGSVVAFSWRTLSTEKKVAKYVNSPETPIFHKSDLLFGMDKAKLQIWQKKHVIVVEGQMDVITLHQAGFQNTVGISWTALTEAGVRQIRRLTDQIYLCLDNDDAGKKAIFSSIETLVNQDVDIRVIQLWKFKDPDEVLKSWYEFQTYIDTAVSHISFMIQEASTQFDLWTVQGKKKLSQKLMPYLSRISSAVEVDLYLQEMSEKIGVSLQILWAEYNVAKKNLRSQRIVEQESDEEHKNKSTTPAEHLMVLLIGTKDVSLFREHFLFFDKINSFPELSSLWSFVTWEHVEADELMKYELIFEEKFADTNKDVLQQKLTHEIRWLNKTLFRELRKKCGDDLIALDELNSFGREHRLT